MLPRATVAKIHVREDPDPGTPLAFSAQHSPAQPCAVLRSLVQRALCAALAQLCAALVQPFAAVRSRAVCALHQVSKFGRTTPVKTNFTNVEICVCSYVASRARVIHDLLICDRPCARVTYFGVYVTRLRLAYICAITYCFSLAVCVRPVICTQVTTLVAM